MLVSSSPFCVIFPEYVLISHESGDYHLRESGMRTRDHFVYSNGEGEFVVKSGDSPVYLHNGTGYVVPPNSVVRVAAFLSEDASRSSHRLTKISDRLYVVDLTCDEETTYLDANGKASNCDWKDRALFSTKEEAEAERR